MGRRKIKGEEKNKRSKRSKKKKKKKKKREDQIFFPHGFEILMFYLPMGLGF
jgi:predicted ribosome quality control (RQC) complex YloA/Tae2 family protein